MHLFNFLISLKLTFFHTYHCQYFNTPPLDQKISDIQKIFLKRSKCVWLPKLDRRLGRMWIIKRNVVILLISSQKLYFGYDDAIFDVIIQQPDWKWRHNYTQSAGIHLLNLYFFRHTQPFSFLCKSTRPILPFVVLTLYNSLSLATIFLNILQYFHVI